jgi:hypothetical protein
LLQKFKCDTFRVLLIPMKYHFSLLCTIGALLPAICFSQGDFRRGYVIKNNGDSLSGFVDYRIGTKSLKTAYFRASKKDATTKFTPEQIMVYGFRGDKRFESAQLPGKEGKVFVEVLVKGQMSLYRHGGTYYVGKDSLIRLVKGEDRTLVTEKGNFVKSQNSYAGVLNILLSDCQLQANATKLNENDLSAIIQNYNRCKGTPGRVYKEAVPLWRINYQLLAGMNTSTLSGDFEKNAFRKDRSLMVGGGVDISFPKSIDRLFISFEANYNSYITHSYIETGSPQIRRTDYFIDASFIRIPFGIRYNFFHDHRTPYIKAGFVKLINLNAELRQFEDIEKNSIVTSSEKTFDLKRDGGLGYWGSVGFGQVVRGHIKVFAEFRIEKSNGFTGHRIVDGSELITTSLLLGIRL